VLDSPARARDIRSSRADLKSKLEEAYETWRDWAQKGDP
jgi:hypothetical protein